MPPLSWERPNRQRMSGLVQPYQRRLVMVPWQQLPWAALACLMCLGPTLGWAAALYPSNDPPCTAPCVAAEEYCTLAFQVSEEQGEATCITHMVAQGGCSDLLAAAGTACPQPVVNAQACTQTLAKDTCTG